MLNHREKEQNMRQAASAMSVGFLCASVVKGSKSTDIMQGEQHAADYP
jgi:hypothetical protein